MLIQKFLNLSFINILIKFFGYVRDMIVAFFFGTSVKSEIFFSMLELQNLFTIFVHPLNFEKNFINIYLNLKLKLKNLQYLFAKSIFIFFSIILIFVGILVLYNLESVLSVFYPGFVDRIDFVYFENVIQPIIIFNIFNFIFVFLSSILQSERKLILNSICLLLPNLFFVIYGLIIYSYFEFNLLIDFFGLFLIFTSCTQILIVIFFGNLELKKILLYKTKFEEIKKYNQYFFKDYSYSFYYLICFKMFFVIKSYFLSYFPGYISYFYFSERLVYLPSTILTTALIVILLPELIIIKKYFDNKKIVNFFLIGVKISFFVMIPLTLFIYLNAEIIIKILFLRGEFDNNSVIIISRIFKVESVSFVFLSLISVFYIFFIFLKKHKILLQGIFFSILLTTLLMYLFAFYKKPEFFAYSFIFYNIFQTSYSLYYFNAKYQKVFWNFINKIKNPVFMLIFSTFIIHFFSNFFDLNDFNILILSTFGFLMLIFLFIGKYKDKDINAFLSLIKNKIK